MISGLRCCVFSTFVLTMAASLSTGCGDPIEEAADVAKACGDQPCPAGTSPKELREVQGSFEIGVGGSGDLTGYSAEGTFSRFGEGSCEYACQVIQPCPDTTFPVITMTCFTCGMFDVGSGTVLQGSCGS